MSGAACPACGETAAAGARFCESCGAPLSAAPVPSPGPAAAPVPAASEEAIDGALAMASDRGRRHATNQDAGAVARRADGAAFLCVADGVSMSENAEGASAAAVAAALGRFAAGPGEGAPEEEARACAAAAAAAVLGVPRAGDDPDLDPPETTIVVAVVRGGVAGLAWVGDSRAYRVAGGAEAALTVDDSWAAEAVARGAMSREAAMRDPRAHAITQCLGMGLDELEIHAAAAELPAGSTLLLCTDGLWNYHDEDGALGEACADAAAGGADAALICRRLVAEANAMGGRDNITAALLVG